MDEPNIIELVRWIISSITPVIAGLGGVILGTWLTGRRETRSRKLAFIEKQLSCFYSPLLGIWSEIHMRGKLHEKIKNTAVAEWHKLCEERKKVGIEALQKLSDERVEEFTQFIEYGNRQLKEELIPAYRKMVDIFRDNMWLAEPETRDYFKPLLEFVELWERWLARSLPPEVIEGLDHGEDLYPFYEHLQKKHDELREKLKQGRV